MSTPTVTAVAAVADHLAASLPVPGLRVVGQVVPDAASRPAAVVSATLVGPRPAELALALVDVAFVAEAGGLPGATPTAVLRPAFEQAAAGLGDGVLSELVEGDTAGLFAASAGGFGEEAAVVFEISDGAGVFGWFAVRVAPAAPAAPAVAPGPAPALTAAFPTADSPFDDRLRRIHDVEMALTVEIGRTRMSVREALALEPGAVVELDRSAGAPVDILLNGRRIALGEVVVVDQDYAVRVSRILDGAEARA